MTIKEIQDRIAKMGKVQGILVVLLSMVVGWCVLFFPLMYLIKDKPLTLEEYSKLMTNVYYNGDEFRTVGNDRAVLRCSINDNGTLKIEQTAITSGIWNPVATARWSAKIGKNSETGKNEYQIVVTSWTMDGMVNMQLRFRLLVYDRLIFSSRKYIQFIETNGVYNPGLSFTTDNPFTQ